MSEYGSVETSVRQQLNSLKQAAQDIQLEVGHIEIRKARLIGSLGEVERRAQQILTEEGKRLGIPEGVAWQVTPEGEVLIDNPPETAPAK
jgi:hypothetical protein